jgi:hypothetical protein
MRACQAAVRLVHLLSSLQNKSDMKACGVWQGFIAEGARIAQDKREAMSIRHDGYGILLLLKALKIKAGLEERARFGKIIDAKVEVVELHEILL